MLEADASTTINRQITSGEAASSYATAREFFARVAEGGNGGVPSTILVERMRGLEIRIRVPPPLGITGGIAPTSHLILVTPGIPIRNPSGLAHEIGHVATWNALDVPIAPLFFQEYGSPDFTWDRLTAETSKVAFIEGAADFFMSVWRWSQATPTPFLALDGNRHGLESANWEVGTATDPWTAPASIPVGNTCAGYTAPHQRVFCHTASLWDVFDDPAGDDDTLSLNIAEIVETLDSYHDNCLPWASNGCANETGDTGLNHIDFQTNAAPDVQDDIVKIYHMNGLTNQ
jgi:hypothetical protein